MSESMEFVRFRRGDLSSPKLCTTSVRSHVCWRTNHAKLASCMYFRGHLEVGVDVSETSEPYVVLLRDVRRRLSCDTIRLTTIR